MAEAGSLAEEVISTVRTAQAFGTQAVLAGLYDVFIGKARHADMKQAIWNGGGLALFFFVPYSAYGLGTCHQLGSIYRFSDIDLVSRVQ